MLYQSPFIEGYWIPVKDGDPRARYLFRQHYSFRPYADDRNPRLFVGPGEKMVLMTLACDALFAWRKEKYRLDGQTGVNCAVFRNTSPILSSLLIREAMELAWARWPGERLFTHVDSSKIKSSNPGCCFKKADWRRCGESNTGLLIFEAYPDSDGDAP